MNIYIFRNYKAVGLITTYKSVIWETQYNDLGEFELQLLPMDIQIGDWLVREADKETGRNMMLVNSIELTSNDEILMTVRGTSLKGLLNQRITTEQITDNNRLNYVINRIINDNFTSPEDTNREINIDIQWDCDIPVIDETQIAIGSYAGDTISELCKEYELGFELEYTDGLILRLYKGNKLDNVLFSEDYGNISNLSFTNDYNGYFNAVVVGGEGEGTNQKSVSVGSTKGLNRYEGYVDGSSLSSNGEIITENVYLQMLRSYGNTQLGQIRSESVSGEIVSELFKLNEDYSLGDIVTIKAFDNTLTSRVISIIYSESEAGIDLVPTFEDWRII